MTEGEAIAIANDYVARSMDPESRIAGERFELRLQSARLNNRGSWSVFYQVTLLDSPGAVVDGGPSVVVVDPDSGKARFLDELHT